MAMTDQPAAISAKLNLNDPAAWSDIVHQHYNLVLRTALAQTRRRSLAEDVAQETFVRAFERHEQFDGQGTLASWLYRIAVNLSRDCLRRENLRSHATLAEAAQNPAADLSPADLAHRKHLSQILRQTLQELPASMRRAFEQTVILGHRYAEVAQAEGVSEGTIASRVARARGELAKKCRELGITNAGDV
jgi:RNA polymerase sigma-70 factor (ECF subfamily)